MASAMVNLSLCGFKLWQVKNEPAVVRMRVKQEN